jgi:hypothetical protein
MRTVVFAGPLLLCVLCVPTGCATDDGAATSQSPAQQAALKARDFYPLAVGNTWTYRSTPGDETRTIAIVREEEGFFIDNNTPPARLQTRSTGVYDGDRFLLEEPLEVGHKWLAVPSASEVERWTYAPQVGLIRIEQRLEMEGANTRSLMTIELIDYELSTSKEAAAAGHRGQGSARP